MKFGTTDVRRNRRAWLAAAAGVIAAGLVLSSCAGPGDSGSDGSDATFRMAVTTVPDTLDPQSSGSGAPMNYLLYGIETLVQMQPDGSLEPLLATEWDVSDDGLEYTFELREGVKFQDGTDFDAAAVEFVFDRLFDEAVRAPNRNLYRQIESVVATDEHTVVITVTEPTPTLVFSLASVTSGIISPTSIDQNGNAYDNIVHPVGTGPYTFTEYVSGTSILFERNESYWGEKPYYGEVEFKIIPEPATREAELLAGTVDVIVAPPASDLEALDANPKVNLIFGESTRQIYMTMNVQSDAFDDVRVRHAMNYAVDKESIAKNVLAGAVTVSTSPVSKLTRGYCATGAYDYDPDKARDLLEEAGASNLEVSLITPTGRYMQDFQFAQAVAGYLEDVGVTVTTETTDWATYLTWVAEPAEAQGNKIAVFGWAGAFPDASVFDGVLTSNNFPPEAYNNGFYSNPDVDAIFANAAGELDMDRRDAMYCEMNQTVWDDAPWIFLWNQGIVLASSANIEGIKTLPNEMFWTVYARPTS